MKPAKKYQDELSRLKRNAERAESYWRDNVNTFHFYNNFIFNTTLSERERNALRMMGRPEIECNLGKPHLMRFLGEFDKQMPNIVVRGNPDEEIDSELIDFMEGHLRDKVEEANREGFSSELLKNTTGGGFGQVQLYSDYKGYKKFDQDLYFKNKEDPTVIFYDPLSRKPCKQDAKYSCEFFIKTAQDVKDDYPWVEIDKLKFLRSEDMGLNWSYSTDKEKLVVLCDYTEVKKIKTMLYELANGMSLIESEYQEFLQEWEESGTPALPPVVVRQRKTFIPIVCRYVFIETEVLKYEETEWSDLYNVYADGNSRLLKTSNGTQSEERSRFEMSELKQKTIPYAYDLVGVQKLNNLSMQSLGYELETISQQRLWVPTEGLPDNQDALDALTTPQKASLITTKQYADKDVNKPLEKPLPLPRAQIPPEVSQTMPMMAQLTQNMLGGHDQDYGQNNSDLSGRAIWMGRLNSDAASKAYLTNYALTMQRVLQIYVNQLPKIVKTPRTMPVIHKDGKKGFITVNKKDGDGVSLNYNEDSLKVTVEIGPSFALQKAMAVQEITTLMKISPAFAEFINERGLEMILDNIEMRGIDHLKELAHEWMEEMRMRKAQAQQQAQTNPIVMREETNRMKVMQDAEKMRIEADLKQQEIDVDKMEIEKDLRIADIHAEARAEDANAARLRTAVDLGIKVADMSHSHKKDLHELHHKLTSATIGQPENITEP